MRKFITLIATFVSTIALAATSGPSSVFVIHATSGSLVPKSGLHREYTLTLDKVSEMISLGSSGANAQSSIEMRDFLGEWKKNSHDLAKTPPVAGLRATHASNPFSANVNIHELTYVANNQELTLTISFLNYTAKRPDMKPSFTLDHPMLVISENALPSDMVKELKTKHEANRPAPSQDQSHGDIVN